MSRNSPMERKIWRMVQIAAMIASAAIVSLFITSKAHAGCYGFTGECDANGSPKTPSVETNNAYYACLNREAKIGVKRALESGSEFYNVDVKRIGEHVLRECTSRFTNGITIQGSDPRYAELTAQNALNSLMSADSEKRLADQRKQAELDAPKLKAESDAAYRRYWDCLSNHAKVIALNSTEVAEVVALAAFASCRDERKMIAEVHIGTMILLVTMYWIRWINS